MRSMFGAKGRTRKEQFRYESGLLREGNRVVIGYTTGDGVYSVRFVTVVDDADANYVWAHCELRGEERCFARRRIEFVAEPSDPELLQDPDYRKLIMTEARKAFPALFSDRCA